MILYGTGEPIEALQKIGAHVRSIHCKDATWAAKPGEEWGAEVPLGEGDVGMESYLRTLLELGYDGPLTIEREIAQEPARQRNEVQHAADLLRRLNVRFDGGDLAGVPDAAELHHVDRFAHSVVNSAKNRTRVRTRFAQKEPTCSSRMDGTPTRHELIWAVKFFPPINPPRRRRGKSVSITEARLNVRRE